MSSLSPQYTPPDSPPLDLTPSPAAPPPPGPRYTTFTVGSLPFRVSRLWFLTPLVVSLFASAAFLLAGTVSWPSALFLGTTIGAILFISLLGHEAAHGVVGTLVGCEVKEILVGTIAVGIALDYDDAPGSPVVWSIIAGPAFNLIVALIVWQLVPFFEPPFSYVVSVAAAINAVLAVGNALPFPPTDGFNLLHRFLGRRTITWLNVTAIVALFIVATLFGSVPLLLVSTFLALTYLLTTILGVALPQPSSLTSSVRS